MAVSLSELEVLISLQTVGAGQLKSLQSGFLGLATGAGLAAVGIGAIYEIGKSALSNYEAQQSATNNLSQAFATQKESVPTKEIQDFLNKNKDFIANQYDVEQGIAAATRAGISWKDTQLLMGDALALSIDRGMSFSDAMDTLVKAAAGGRAQLAYLGITSTSLTADTNVLANAQKAANKADDEKAKADRALQEELVRLHDKHTVTQSDLMHLADLKAKDLLATQNDTNAHKALTDAQKAANDQGDRAATLHDKLAPKLAGETGTVTDLQKAQHDLNKDWQDFSTQIGPGLTGVITSVYQALDTGVQILDLTDQFLGKLYDRFLGFHGLGSGVGGLGAAAANATQPGHGQSPNMQTIKILVSAASGTTAKVLRQASQV